MTHDTDSDDRTDENRLAGLAGLGATATRDDDARERTAERIRRAGGADEEVAGATRSGTAANAPGESPTVPLFDGGTLARAFAVPSTYKVKGELADQGGTGVFGHATAVAGSGRGVFGQADSVGADTAGVRGLAAAGSGETTGVHGETASSAVAAEGVRASALAGDAAALRATARDGGHGVEATTDGDQNYAVWGRHIGKAGTDDDHGVVGETFTAADGVAGVKGIARDTDANGTHGVKGISDAAANASTHPAGVYGEATATSGEPHGVHGTTAATAGYGVYSGGDAKTDGDHEVTGSVSAGNVGADAYRSSNQEIPDSTTTTVAFDQTEADHFGGFDTSTGVYTVQEDGDYHVDFAIRWASTFSGVAVEYMLYTGASGFEFIEKIVENSNNGRGFGKTVFGLTAGDPIEVRVRQFSGGSGFVRGLARGDTYVTIHRVG